MARKKRTDKTGHVLRNGEMQRSSDGLYMYRYNNMIGQRKTVYAPSLMELRTKEQEIQRDIQDGIDTTKGDMTLNELFQLYMKMKTNIRESTRENYKALWRNKVENDPLGNMPICKIKQINIRAFYSSLADQGLSDSTIQSYHGLLRPVFEMAVDSDMIRKNPTKDCLKDIGNNKAERKALTREEEKALVDYVNGSDRFCIYAPLIIFALNSAMRMSEISGLEWKNIDLKKGIIHVTHQLVYKDFGDGYKYHIEDTKTRAGIRDIPLTDDARKALMDERELCFSLGIKSEEVEGISDFIFLNLKGKPHTAIDIDRELRFIIKAYNEEHPDDIQLPHFSVHVLRHTACTRFAEAGLPPKMLQSIMGHSKIGVTMDVYTHLDFDQIQEKVNEVQENIKIG